MWQADEVSEYFKCRNASPYFANQDIKVMVKWPTDATRMIESFMEWTMLVWEICSVVAFITLAMSRTT